GDGHGGPAHKSPQAIFPIEDANRVTSAGGDAGRGAARVSNIGIAAPRAWREGPGPHANLPAARRSLPGGPCRPSAGRSRPEIRRAAAASEARVIEPDHRSLLDPCRILHPAGAYHPEG